MIFLVVFTEKFIGDHKIPHLFTRILEGFFDENWARRMVEIEIVLLGETAPKYREMGDRVLLYA